MSLLMHEEEKSRDDKLEEYAQQKYKSLMDSQAFVKFVKEATTPLAANTLMEFLERFVRGDRDPCYRKGFQRFFELLITTPGLFKECHISHEGLFKMAIRCDPGCALILMNMSNFNWDLLINNTLLCNGETKCLVYNCRQDINAQGHQVILRVYSDKRTNIKKIMADFLEYTRYFHPPELVLDRIKAIESREGMDIRELKVNDLGENLVAQLVMRGCTPIRVLDYLLDKYPDLMDKQDDYGRRAIDQMDFDFQNFLMFDTLVNYVGRHPDCQIKLPTFFGRVVWEYAHMDSVQHWLQSTRAHKDEYLLTDDEYKVKGAHNLITRYRNPERCEMVVNQVFPYCAVMCHSKCNDYLCKKNVGLITRSALPQQLFVMAEFIQVGYLRINPLKSDNQEVVELFNRFMRILTLIPLEMIMMICCYAAGRGNPNLSSAVIQTERKRFLLFVSLCCDQVEQ